jgi:alpha-L-arabinofuranosidase
LKHHADYLSLHMYVGNTENKFADFVASSEQLNERIRISEGIIRAAMSDTENRSMFIAWDEWNVWYRARGSKERGREILEERYNLEDALVVATFLNTFVNNAHIVKIANMAQLVNVIAPIFANKSGLFLQTIYYPLQLFASNSFGNALELFVDGPTYTSKYSKKTPLLNISAAYDKGELVINVVNRSEQETASATFELEDKKYAGAFEVSEVNGPEIKSENTFDKTLVKTSKKSVDASGNRLQYQFAPHSYTMLKGKLA